MLRVENSGNNNIVKIENESKINGRLVIKGDNNDVFIHLSSGDALDICIEGDFNSLYLDGSRIGRLRAILKTQEKSRLMSKQQLKRHIYLQIRCR